MKVHYRTSSAAVLLAFLAGTAAGQIDATYIGPSGGLNGDPANWDIGVVPVNGGGDTYNLFFPASINTRWQLYTGDHEINDLTIGDASYHDLYTGVNMTVLGNAMVDGAYIRCFGGNIEFTNPGGFDALNVRQLHATTGGSVTVNSTSFDASPFTGPFSLDVRNASSTIDASSVQTIMLAPNYGANFYSWYGGGTLDLSNTTDITWGGTGQLYLYAYDGNIDLASLTNTDGPIRVHADLDGLINLPNAPLPGLTRIEAYGNSTINAQSVTDLGGVLYIRGGTSQINLGALPDIDGARFDIRSGATLTTTHSAYSGDGFGGYTSFHAQNPGTLIDASSIQTLQVQDNAQMNLYAWYGGAQLDLSGLDTVTGDNSFLYVYAYDGTIDLTDLDLVVPRLRLHTDLNGTINVSSTAVMDRLERIDALNGGVVNLPGVVDANGTYFNLSGPTSAVNLAGGGTLNGAQFYAAGAHEFVYPNSIYSAVGYNTRTPFHAVNAGTHIDASALQSLELDVSGNVNMYAWYSGATLDLSGLQTVTGGSGQFYVYAFDGAIDLTGLQNVATRARLDVDSNGTITVSPTAEFANLEYLEIYNGGTLNVPGLTDIDDMVVELSAAYTFNHGGLKSANGARIYARNGANFTMPGAITNYDTPTLHSTAFGAYNAGTLLDMTSLDTISVGTGLNVDFHAWYDGATLDMSNVSHIMGTFENGRRAYFYAFDGTIDLSGLQACDVNISIIAAQGGTVLFGADCIARGHALSAANGSTIVCGGDMLSTATGASNGYGFTDSTLVMNGAGIKLLEVASEDVGMPVDGSELNDFRIGHLTIGDAGGFQTVVELRDCYNNNNRTGGVPEALYITGIDGAAGLEIAANATLVLNDIETYAWDGSAWVHLNSLFGGGQQCIAYAGGQLCIGGCRADFNPDGNLDFFDVLAYLGAFTDGELRADFTCDGMIDFFDVLEFLSDFTAGCP